ncbi:MAG: putative sortase [Candidatus Saccharibacteria bacterium]|nr:putative sortase [Candidatus Saccharibacteria bacterium]MDB5180615.1 putative sortase [Candidatus Saccharibacteria bacterium]
MKPEISSSGGNLSNGTPANQNQNAAANVIRSQIDAMYGGNAVASPQPQTQPQAAAPLQDQSQPQAQHTANPYDRNHEQHPQPEAEQWKQYHSAWQTYYQKYYEGYYAAQQTPAAPTSQQPTQAIGSASSSDGFFTQQTDLEATTDELNKDQALYELRQKLLGKVQDSAKKIRGSRHFIPIAASLAVVLIFVFLQYNRIFIASVNAYVSPGTISQQNIVIDPSGDTSVTAESRLIIPKINVDVPAIYNVGNDYNSQMAAMSNGVAHFAIPGASSHPGQVGNTVLSGHSSNDLFDGGDYKFIFAQLEKMAVGDTIYTNYESKRYTYVVTKTEVVKPSEVGKLVYPTTKPMLTLITCTPLGTALNRLLVTAEQVSPDPAQAVVAPVDDGTTADADIPGNSPTFFERLFGAR